METAAATAQDGAMAELIRQSTLTCPSCGARMAETMPLDACVFFHECSGCGALLQPDPGDCCVFCSHGDVACPPVQQHDSCCSRDA